MIEFRCGNCNQKIVTKDALSGKRVRCPKCSDICTVPDTSTKIKFRCKSCGQKISVPEIHAGKRAKCPRCKSAVVVPQVVPQKLMDKQPVESPSQKPDIDSLMFESPQAEPAPAQSFEQQERELSQALSPTMSVYQKQPSKQRKFSWPIDIFLYPSNKAGLTMIGIIVGVPLIFGLIFGLVALLIIICPLFFIFLPALQIVGFIISVVFGMYLYWYLCECIRDSANGGIRAPETIGETPGLGELFSQSLKTIGCLLFFALPALIYFFSTSRTDANYWILFAIGIFLFPMGLLAVIMFDSFAGLNPILIIGSVLSTFFPYLGLIVLLFAVILFVGLLIPLFGLILSGGNVFVILGMIFSYGSGIIGFYIMMVMSHLLGRFYWRYQDKLNWEV